MDCYRLHIEFLRIQTFLFAVPYLKEMLGANVLLGELIRDQLPQKLKAFAEENSDAVWRPSDKQLAGLNLNQSDEKDPLHKSCIPDDPRAQYQQGILSRDGGHFSALFSNKTDALKFKALAAKLIRQEIPGLRFQITVSPFIAQSEAISTKPPTHLPELPIFQLCQASGNQVAGYIDKAKDNQLVSNQVKRLREKAKLFNDNRKQPGTTKDIIGLISPQLYNNTTLNPPSDLGDLCGNDYLAVIHADGNDIGGAIRRLLQNLEHNSPVDDFDEVLKREAQVENFFHSMRVLFRRAVLMAVAETFKDFHGKITPYQLLMLGGDDVLMICRAQFALPFTQNLAHALEKLQEDKAAEEQITIGAGIVISKPSVPFYLLHQHAELMAASAKCFYRQLPADQKKSVVDWQIHSYSWLDDPMAWRKKSHTRTVDNELLISCIKPYPILGDKHSLQTLFCCAESLNTKLADIAPARSQLRFLKEQLLSGRLLSDLIFNEMPNVEPVKLRRLLLDCLKQLSGNEQQSSLWQAIANGSNTIYSTYFADLVEIYEIKRLGKASKTDKEVNHDSE